MHSAGGGPEGPGFPIRTSQDRRSVTSSSGLFAGSHVLHRLSTPRHPPCALRSFVAPTRRRGRLRPQPSPSLVLVRVDPVDATRGGVPAPRKKRRPLMQTQTSTQALLYFGACQSTPTTRPVAPLRSNRPLVGAGSRPYPVVKDQGRRRRIGGPRDPSRFPALG